MKGLYLRNGTISDIYVEQSIGIGTDPDPDIALGIEVPNSDGRGLIINATASFNDYPIVQIKSTNPDAILIDAGNFQLKSSGELISTAVPTSSNSLVTVRALNDAIALAAIQSSTGSLTYLDSNNLVGIIPSSKLSGNYDINITGSSSSALKLINSRSISITGDASWSAIFDGSSNVTAELVLSDSGIMSGTYNSVTVDAKGRVTAGSNPSTLDGYGIIDATPLSHVGSNGVSHSVASTTLDGFMSSVDKVKLNSIEAYSNNYVHPNVNGTLHVPVTNNSSIGKFLKATSGTGDFGWYGIYTTDIENIGNSASLNVGTTTGTVAAGDDIRLTNAVLNSLTINGKALTSNIVLSASDIGALTLTDVCSSAIQLQTSRIFTWTGDINGSLSFNGLTDVNSIITLSNSGVAAGTYKSVTVDVKGRVTAGTNPTTLSGYGITDAAIKTHNHDTVYQPINSQLTAIANLSSTGYLKNNNGTWVIDNNVSTNQIITLSGDVSGSGASTISVLLNDSGVTSGTYNSVTVDAKGRVTAGTNPTTISGYGITDATPLSHVGSSGTAHAVATSSVSGFMSALDKVKIDGIESNANNYVHPIIDGFMHVPVTTTTHGLQFLQAGSTAGSFSWVQVSPQLNLIGDATGSTTFTNLTSNSLTLTLANSGVTAGTYKSVTVDAKGRVTSGTNPSTLAGYGITDAVLSSTTINGKALTSNISLTSTDVGALSSTANAVSASKLANAFTIQLTGDTTGSAITDGSSSAVVNTSISANTILSKLSTVDGSGSALDSDTVDGLHASQFVRSDVDSIINANLTITGNVTLSGGTSIIKSTVMQLSDPVITLGGVDPLTIDDGKDRGIDFNYYTSSAKLGFFGFSRSTNKFTVIPQSTVTGGVYSGTKGEVDAYIDYSNVINKPSTLAGYGITDAVSNSGTIAYAQGSSTSVLFSSSTTASNQVIDSVLISEYRTVKYITQLTSGSMYQYVEIVIIHDGTTPYISEIGSISTSGLVLATFDTLINAGNLQFVFTPVNATTTVKAIRTCIAI
jgi:phage-related tail fiber protein